VIPVDMDYDIPDMLRPNARMHTFVNPLNDANQHSRRQYIHGQVLWDPLKLIGHWGNRAAVFFISFAFALGTLSTNVPANSLSAGSDMPALWPCYINIRCGQVICESLGGWVLLSMGNSCEVRAKLRRYHSAMADPRRALNPTRTLHVDEPFCCVHP
jgi:hypothetical protein